MHPEHLCIQVISATDKHRNIVQNNKKSSVLSYACGKQETHLFVYKYERQALSGIDEREFTVAVLVWAVNPFYNIENVLH